MPDLERIVESVAAAEKLPKHFRLWLTTAPSDVFPGAVLRRSVKLTNEPPRGLKLNMLVNLPWTGSLASVPPAECKGSLAEVVHRQLHFGLVFFHALVQERRKVRC